MAKTPKNKLTKKIEQSLEAMKKEIPIPAYGGNPIQWLVDLARTHGMHPRTAVGSPRIWKLVPEKDKPKFNAELLAKAAVATVEAIKDYVAKHNKEVEAGKTHGWMSVKEDAWIAYGTQPVADHAAKQSANGFVPGVKKPAGADSHPATKPSVNGTQKPHARVHATKAPTPAETTPEIARPAQANVAKKNREGQRGSKFSLMGYPVSNVLRWMGKHGFKFSQARAVLDSSGLKEVSDSTVKAQLADGAGKMQRGDPAPVTKKEAEQLHSLAQGKKWTPTSEKPSRPVRVAPRSKGGLPQPRSRKSSSSGAKSAKKPTSSKSSRKSNRRS